ncbi:unnamed protein product [Phytophthora fragariaefolia]|uniref:Unnamed protein product n=1 Tax=Phytophthora fragariaefolia TaxID=1490495 RepID=A0A9W7D784_9STRA|nr:unnamed protein product [Phytophthora fragariaefolia]
MRTFATRWIVQSPSNNIEEGDVLNGGVNRVNCPPIPVNDLSICHEVASYFYTALSTGKLEEFTGHDLADTAGFTNLSQVSSVSHITASQLSFVGEGSLEQVAAPALTREPVSVSEGSARLPIVFTSPPKRNGLTRRTEKKIETGKEMQEAKQIRRFNVDQPVPVITAIPQREKFHEAIEIIDQKDNPELLARWRDYGCATYGQLNLMDYVVTAKNNVNCVDATLEWIDKAKFQANNMLKRRLFLNRQP